MVAEMRRLRLASGVAMERPDGHGAGEKQEAGPQPGGAREDTAVPARAREDTAVPASLWWVPERIRPPSGTPPPGTPVTPHLSCPSGRGGHSLTLILKYKLTTKQEPQPSLNASDPQPQEAAGTATASQARPGQRDPACP